MKINTLSNGPDGRVYIEAEPLLNAIRKSQLAISNGTGNCKAALDRIGSEIERLVEGHKEQSKTT